MPATNSIFTFYWTIGEENQSQAQAWAFSLVSLNNTISNELNLYDSAKNGQSVIREPCLSLNSFAVSAKRENGGRNPCELWIQSEVHRTGTQRCFELEMGHIWYQGLRELKVTHRRPALPSCFVLSWEFTFPEFFTLPAFFSLLTTTCKNKLHERWAGGLFLGTKFSYSLL